MQYVRASFAPAMVERIEQGHPGLDLAAQEPMGRIGRPEEIAAAVTWPCYRASFVTGQAQAVDGGWVAQ